jgi:hypothetical protein
LILEISLSFFLKKLKGDMYMYFYQNMCIY